jgi:hypothetical protein
MYPVKPTAHDMCPKGCFLFGDQTICPSCGGHRYKTNGTPTRQMKVLPIGRQLGAYLYHKDIRSLLFDTPYATDATLYKDIYNGDKINSIDRDHTDIYIGLYMDGFGSVNKPSQSLVFPCTLVCGTQFFDRIWNHYDLRRR